MNRDRPQGREPQGPRPGLFLHLRGLKAQIVLWTVLPLTLVLIGVAFTGVYSHEQTMRDLVQERDQALAVISAAQVRDRLQGQVTALQALAAQDAFLHRDSAAQAELLAGVDSVVLVDGSGALLAGDAPGQAWTQDGRLAELSQAILGGQDVAVVGPGAEGLVLVGVPARDTAGQVYGSLVAPISLDDLSLAALLSQLPVGEHSQIYLVDDSGQVLACAPVDKARPTLAEHTGLETVLQEEGAGATLCQSPAGERMALAYAPVEFADAGWRVLVAEPWSEVVGPVLRYSQFMPLVAALAAIVSLLTLYYGVRSIARPLQTLGEKAERVAWGDFEATSTPVGGVQEIEDLRRTLDQMAKRIQSYQSGMHDYIAAITQGQEEERKRLARELHDDTAQALIALGQQVEMARKHLDSDPQSAAERLDQVREMLTETLESVRRFSRDLRPIYLEDLGFLPALEMLVKEADRREGLAVQLTVSGAVHRLPSDLELAAYRIVQETLRNVVQHAGAAHAWVEVRFESEHLVLSVRDDGQGFVPPDLPDALARRGHFGLMGIQERALLCGGRAAIHSAPGAGTEVSVRLPYSAQP